MFLYSVMSPDLQAEIGISLDLLRTFKMPNWTIVYGWQGRENWSLPLFMFVLSYGLILYLLSVILFPTDMPES